MKKYVKHIVVLLFLLCSFLYDEAQVSMPDTVCVGTIRTYSVNTAGGSSTYEWKVNGVVQTQTGHLIIINWPATGIYQLTVQERNIFGCLGDIRSGTITVLPAPQPHAGPDITVCYGDIATLTGSGGITYNWSPPVYLSNPSISNPAVHLPAAGTFNYYLTVSTNNGCTSTLKDTVAVTMLPPLHVFAGNDTSVSVNQLLQLNAIDIDHAGIVDYNWSPPVYLNNNTIQNPTALFPNLIGDNGITYILTAHDALGCMATDNIVIHVFARSDVYMPNAFSPNVDGLNDLARPVLIGIKELKYFTIFNRYGQQVFTTTTQKAGWNGTLNGELQPMGNYVWILQAVDYKGNIITKKGNIVLVR